MRDGFALIGFQRASVIDSKVNSPQMLPLWETTPGKGLQVYKQELTSQQ